VLCLLPTGWIRPDEMELVSGELVTPSDRSIDRYARRASGIVVTNGVSSDAHDRSRHSPKRREREGEKRKGGTSREEETVIGAIRHCRHTYSGARIIAGDLSRRRARCPAEIFLSRGESDAETSHGGGVDLRETENVLSASQRQPPHWHGGVTS
jgi:hypothetical protein